jgi:predicted O-methyltransferase YrrM
MHRTTRRQLAGTLGIAFVAAVLTGAIFAGGPRAPFGSVLLVAAVIAVATGYLGWCAGRFERALTAGLRQQRARTGALAQRLEQFENRTNRQLSTVKRAVNQLPDRLAEPYRTAITTASHGLQDRVPRRVYAKVEAHADLRALVRPRAPMPPLDDWALDADVMHLVASLLWERRPELIVECGSGSSSVWLGYLVEQLGTGRVVSLEHDPRFRQVSRDLVRAHGLQHLIDVREAPLREWSDPAGTSYQWYADQAVADLAGIDLVLVDGPPGGTGQQARYPAAPLLLPRCSGRAVLVLDDANRPDEQAISDRWLAEWPDLVRTSHRQGHAHVFARTADPRP